MTKIKTTFAALQAVIIQSGRLYGQRGVIIGPGQFHNHWFVFHGESGKTVELHACDFEVIGGAK